MPDWGRQVLRLKRDHFCESLCVSVRRCVSDSLNMRDFRNRAKGALEHCGVWRIQGLDYLNQLVDIAPSRLLTKRQIRAEICWSHAFGLPTRNERNNTFARMGGGENSPCTSITPGARREDSLAAEPAPRLPDL